MILSLEMHCTNPNPNPDPDPNQVILSLEMHCTNPNPNPTPDPNQVILSLEMHCKRRGQEMIAAILKQHLGDALLHYEELDGLRDVCPAALQGRVLCKGKAKGFTHQTYLGKLRRQRSIVTAPSLAAARAATYRSRGPHAGSGLPSRPKRRGTLRSPPKLADSAVFGLLGGASLRQARRGGQV